MRFFLPPLPKTEAEYAAMVRKIYGDLADKFLELYPATNIEESALAAGRDAFYGWSAVRLARAQPASACRPILLLRPWGPGRGCGTPGGLPRQRIAIRIRRHWLEQQTSEKLAKKTDDAQEKALSEAVRETTLRVSPVPNCGRAGRPPSGSLTATLWLTWIFATSPYLGESAARKYGARCRKRSSHSSAGAPPELRIRTWMGTGCPRSCPLPLTYTLHLGSDHP